MDELRLEGLAHGRRHASAGRPTVGAHESKAFARRSDPQPFHPEDAAARNSVVGGLAASGRHTAPPTMRRPVESGFRLAGGIVRAGMDELRRPRPVSRGQEPRVGTEVLEALPPRSRPDQGVAKARTTTLDGCGGPVRVLAADLAVPRRRSAAGQEG
ncbi:MAG: dehydratase [Acetobacteraceae bacterium]|nr:dehydratase [Acetobacteraceae bacterium]